jgi:hypothetical protein
MGAWFSGRLQGEGAQLAPGHLDQGSVLHAAIVTRLKPVAQALPHNAAGFKSAPPCRSNAVCAPPDGRVVQLLFAVGTLLPNKICY